MQKESNQSARKVNLNPRQTSKNKQDRDLTPEDFDLTTEELKLFIAGAKMGFGIPEPEPKAPEIKPSNSATNRKNKPKSARSRRVGK